MLVIMLVMLVMLLPTKVTVPAMKLMLVLRDVIAAVLFICTACRAAMLFEVLVLRDTTVLVREARLSERLATVLVIEASAVLVC